MDSYRLLMLAVLCLTGNAVKGDEDNDQTSNDSKGVPTIPSCRLPPQVTTLLKVRRVANTIAREDSAGNLKDTGAGLEGDKHENSNKLKRELSIVGPIPSSYRGQATGQTTFDGIQAGDLQLPNVDTTRFGKDQQHTRPVKRLRGERQLPRSSLPSTFGEFSTDSASDVYNFDGKEPVTYDGILASDLMVPLPHVSRISSNRNPSQLAVPGFSQQYQQNSQQYQQNSQQYQQNSQQYQQNNQQYQQNHQQVPRQVDSSVDDVFPGDLTLPTLFTVRQVFSRPAVPEFSKPQLRDGALFQPETPAERYKQLQEQYQATLEEYRNSLARFRQQLQKYSTLSRHKKMTPV